MEEELLKKICQLKELLDNDERVLELKTKEKIMEENEEVMVLAYRYSCRQTEYNDALKHYGESSNELLTAQKQLADSKKELESHPLVIDYLKAFQKVRELYQSIDEHLFGPFKKSIMCKEKK